MSKILILFCFLSVHLSAIDFAFWQQHVGSKPGIWVSVEKQELYLVQNQEILARYPCSTARLGTGNRQNSNCTPLGWHVIDERIGQGLPRGAIFRERKFTYEVWDPINPATGEDLILSRILWLRGTEPGKNLGLGIDSHQRYIYIHGTQDEASIGTPSSHGCIRLKNDDIIKLFDKTTSGMPVFIEG